MCTAKHTINPAYTSVILLAICLASAAAGGDDTAGRAAAESGRLREALSLYTQALQSAEESSAQEQAYREIIIGLALRLDPPPAVPDAVISFEGRAEAALKSAKTTEDYLDAAREYRKALLAAPWLASDYFNLGIVLEKAGQTAESIRQFKFYLRAAPDATDAVEVKKKIAGLEYEIEKAASSRAREEDRQRAEEAARAAAEQARLSAARNLAGYWKDAGNGIFHYRIDVAGERFEIFLIRRDAAHGFPTKAFNQKVAYGTIVNGELHGHAISTSDGPVEINGRKGYDIPGNYPFKSPGVVSSDGNRLEQILYGVPTTVGFTMTAAIGPLVRE
ncbi:MAG: hypothetical protein HYV75_04610 [Opitutae bacterium]|nr:hypothetical protein [Opitutae bacterium]